VDTNGLSIGTPLRGFQGILSGAPTYRGDTAPLMHPEASAHALGEGSDGIGNG
jgi:circadian clock protein KaiC